MHRLLGTGCHLVAAALVIAGAAACQVTDEPSSVKRSVAPAASSEALQAFDPPPSEPPIVTVDDVHVPALNFDWRNSGSGEQRVVAPDASLTVDDLPLVTSRGGEVEPRLDSGVWPGEVGITLFEEVGPDRLPLGMGSDVDCFESPLCEVSEGGGNSIDLRFNLEGDVEVVILHIYYPIAISPEGSNEADVGLNYASYGFRVTHQLDGEQVLEDGQ